MFERIAEIIAEQFDIEVEDVTLDTTLEDLDADSIDLVELSMALEDEYDIGEMTEEDLAGISTVGDFIHYIQAHVEGQ